MRLKLVGPLLLFIAQTAQAGFQKSCVELFMPPGVQEYKINYQTKPMADVDGRPLIRNIMAGKPSIDAPFKSQLILTTDLRKTDDYNDKVRRRERVMNPVPGGQIGLGVNEQWLFYIKSQTPKIINDLLAFHASSFTPE